MLLIPSLIINRTTCNHRSHHTEFKKHSRRKGTLYLLGQSFQGRSIDHPSNINVHGGSVAGGGGGAGHPGYFLVVAVVCGWGGDRRSMGGRHRPRLKGRIHVSLWQTHFIWKCVLKRLQLTYYAESRTYSTVQISRFQDQVTLTILTTKRSIAY